MFLQELSKNEIVFQVSGVLSGEIGADMQKKFDEILAGTHSTVSLDLSQATGISTMIIGKLLVFRKNLAERKKTLQIRGCGEELYKTLLLIRLDRIISIEK